MKILILIRHAKSSWNDAGQKDFDRPLNDRGHKDALAMAERMTNSNLNPDGLISSTAKRALSTCEYFRKAFGLDKKNMMERPELYLAEMSTFYQVIQSLPNDLNTVFLFSHNNGITEFANTLTDTTIDNMPTCGVFAVSADIEDWKDFEEGDKDFLFFVSPKEFR